VKKLEHDDIWKIIFTDASAKDSQLGAGVMMVDSSRGPKTRLISIGSATRWNLHLVKLMAICYTTEMIQEEQS